MRVRIVFSLLLLALTASQTHASTLFAYDSLHEDGGYESIGNWFGTLGSQQVQLTAAFTAEATGSLETLSLAIFSGGGGDVELSLSGDPAGDALWQQTVAAPQGRYGSLLELDELDGPLLTAGHDYWLRAVVGSGMHRWYFGAQYRDPESLALLSADLGLRVTVSAVPLPGAVWVLLSACTALLGMRRRRI